MRYWSLLFLLATVISIGACVYAPFDVDWALPNYASSNKQVIAGLEGARDRLRDLADRQAALLERTGAEADAGPVGGELAESEAALLDELEEAREVIEAVASQNILMPRSGAADRRAGEAAGAMASAIEDLKAESLEAARANLTAAREALGDASDELSALFEEIDRPASTLGLEVDHLFHIILAITGIAFIGTELALCWAMWSSAAKPGRKAQYFHGSQRLEVIWTIIPAAILVFIALYQMGTWSSIKFRSAQPRVRPLAEVTARQFQWAIRYPGPDDRLGTRDDLHTVNDLRFVKNTDVVIYLKSQDVLHSFFLPAMRIKQDAVPGLTIPVWFDASQAGHYELVCAELCGWGHYKMRGQVRVYDTQREFDEWMAEELRRQNQDRLSPDGDQLAAAVGQGEE